MNSLKGDKPESDRGTLIDHSVGLTVSVGDEELQDDVNEECYLSHNVKDKEVFVQSPEKPEFQGCEEGRVHCPYQYEFRPCPVPPAFFCFQFKFVYFDFLKPL